ncbi:MAG: hypothetical protein K8S55_13960 [Phycisphaerae bacterium]|nr:hypothetical protein [Phycisphaerae bacterium]
MRKLIGVSLITTCLFVAGVLLAGDKSNTKVKATEYVFVLPSFDAVSIKDADKAANNSVDAYYKAVRYLLTQLRNSKTPAAKTYTIYLLGTFRAKQAVWDLVKIIDFKATHVDPKTRIGRWGPYPAQEALSKIGFPSVEPIVKALGKEENQTRRKLMLMVLLDVLGKDVAQFVLQRASKTATDKEKPRYEKATSLLKSWK